MKSNRCVNTAATLQAVYLVWLFLCITIKCNLSVFGFVHGKFPESFAHAQTVDTRPLFPPNTYIRGLGTRLNGLYKPSQLYTIIT